METRRKINEPRLRRCSAASNPTEEPRTTAISKAAASNPKLLGNVVVITSAIGIERPVTLPAVDRPKFP